MFFCPADLSRSAFDHRKSLHSTCLFHFLHFSRVSVCQTHRPSREPAGTTSPVRGVRSRPPWQWGPLEILAPIALTLKEADGGGRPTRLQLPLHCCATV